jgi:hypothetical protein
MWYLKKILFIIAVIAVCISFVYLTQIIRENNIKKNYIPVEAKVTSVMNAKINRRFATRLKVKYVFNNETREGKITTSYFTEYSVGGKIIIYINPKDENDIRVIHFLK